MDNNIIKEKYEQLGRIKIEEIVLVFAFLFLCILWMTRKLPFGDNLGWNYFFPVN